MGEGNLPGGMQRTALTWASLAAFLLFFLAAGVSLARPVSLVLESLRHPAIYLETLPRPGLFLPLAALWAVLGYAVIHAHLAPRRLSRPAAVLFLVLCSGLILLRTRAAPQNTPRPAVRAEAALEQVAVLVEASARDTGDLPTTFPLEGPLPGAGTGYLGRGRVLPFRVVSRQPGATAPLTAREGDPPGTIYYRRDERDPRRYWLTVLILGAHPVGPTRFLRDLDGKPVVREGRARAPGGRQ